MLPASNSTLLIALALLAIFVGASVAFAQAGCCSGHGGVCGCACCDGKPLSAKCLAKNPACGSSAASSDSAPSSEFNGNVVSVKDGDTIEVMHDGKAERIRLYGIDAPEKAQAFGQKAKQATSDLVFGKSVKIIVKDHDRYGRTVGVVVMADGKTLNAELVRIGMAWWYKQYAPNDAELQMLESEARTAKAGLWVDPNPTPPWEWRHK
jgi:endonuclease YncB( thermonuclease family)